MYEHISQYGNCVRKITFFATNIIIRVVEDGDKIIERTVQQKDNGHLSRILMFVGDEYVLFFGFLFCTPK